MLLLAKGGSKLFFFKESKNLQKARKQNWKKFFCHLDYWCTRLVHFPGDTLWQGEDDKKLVTLIRRNREVQVSQVSTKPKRFRQTPNGNIIYFSKLCMNYSLPSRSILSTLVSFFQTTLDRTQSLVNIPSLVFLPSLFRVLKAS